MSVIFETKKDLDREEKAVSLFCKEYGLTYGKLHRLDIDFKIYKDNKFVFYLEVKGRMRKLNECYPLPISVKKLIKISDKSGKAVVLWACLDGIVFSYLHKLKGDIRIGGRRPREGSSNDIEFMAYYNKNSNLKQLYYE